jgi:hypothetical protein
MLTKKNPNYLQEKSFELKRDNSQKTKKSLFADVSNKNLNMNTSIDEIKKEDYPTKNFNPRHN